MNFEKQIQVIRQEEQEIRALELLLGAEWYPEMALFCRTDRGVAPTGIPWHWQTYYNRQGEEIRRNDVVNGNRFER